MTFLDEIERGPIAAPDIMEMSGKHLALELTETLKLAVPIALTPRADFIAKMTDL